MPRIESVVQESNGKIDLAKVSTKRRREREKGRKNDITFDIDKNRAKLNSFHLVILSR